MVSSLSKASSMSAATAAVATARRDWQVRSAPRPVITNSAGIERLDCSWRASGIDCQLFDASLCIGQPLLTLPAQHFATSIKRNRFVQRNVPALQPVHNGFQFAQCVFE